MISSRDTKELHPKVQAKLSELLLLCKKENIDILITSTYRDKESQDALYAQGRTTKGKRVTNAKGGQSFHNYRVAFDFVPASGVRVGSQAYGSSGEGKCFARSLCHN